MRAFMQSVTYSVPSGANAISPYLGAYFPHVGGDALMASPGEAADCCCAANSTDAVVRVDPAPAAENRVVDRTAAIATAIQAGRAEALLIPLSSQPSGGSARLHHESQRAARRFGIGWVGILSVGALPTAQAWPPSTAVYPAQRGEVSTVRAAPGLFR